eukprot:scaffold1527_cov101-Isochrysis_galbana.AAC.4
MGSALARQRSAGESGRGCRGGRRSAAPKEASARWTSLRWPSRIGEGGRAQHRHGRASAARARASWPTRSSGTAPAPRSWTTAAGRARRRRLRRRLRSHAATASSGRAGIVGGSLSAGSEEREQTCFEFRVTASQLRRALLHAGPRAKGQGAVDRTRYGRHRSCPSEFVVHHVQRLSKAAVVFDAKYIQEGAVSLKQRVCVCVRHICMARCCLFFLIYYLAVSAHALSRSLLCQGPLKRVAGGGVATHVAKMWEWALSAPLLPLAHIGDP